MFLTLWKRYAICLSSNRPTHKGISDRIRIQNIHKYHYFGQITSPKGSFFSICEMNDQLKWALDFSCFWQMNKSLNPPFSPLASAALSPKGYENVVFTFLSSFPAIRSSLLYLNAIQVFNFFRKISTTYLVCRLNLFLMIIFLPE